MILNEKIELWLSENTKFFKSIELLDLKTVKEYLEKEYPKSLQEIITEEEDKTLPMNDYEKLIDDYEKLATDCLNGLYKNPEKDEMLELLASYWVFQTKGHNYLFIRNYFALTKKYETALSYAEKLVTSLSFMRESKLNWLSGVVYNDNNFFFDKFIDILKTDIKPNENYISVLTLGMLVSGKKYNIESWKKFYFEYFDTFFDNKYIDIDSVFYQLLKSQIKAVNKEHEKHVQPIIDFLIEDYAQFTEIEKFEQIMVQLCYAKAKKLNETLEEMCNPNSQNKRKQLGQSFRTLSTESSIRKNNEELTFYINQTIEYNSAQDCLQFFEKIGLPENYYSVLKNYVDLKSNMPEHNIKNTVKKI